ncbi:MAG: UDP-N-acetylmuramoyl-tripeptide--D-alanyl-D-alanine ligase [Acidimicrobiales bacterium]|nr:UDP-N-acetylmuramoyl-tripeptide--D-alanyl-D-alanine ligase [Acidimicrobiales bacterium]
MTWLEALTAGAAVASITVGLLRWLRVSQREHYIAGSCWQTAWRWARRRPPNLVLGFVVDAALVAMIVLTVAEQRTPMLVAALIAAVASAAFPWPMPVRGTPPLRFTRRATTLAATAVGISALVIVLVGVASTWFTGLALAAGLTFLAVDAAARIATPLERRALEQHRRRAESRLRQIDPFVIAVTGSWGKTSTKNHIRDLIAGSAEVVASPASWNNTAGLSRTVNEHLTPTTEVMIAEMGTYGPGEIRDMCSWVKPRVGVICAIGPMHLERMRTIGTVVAAKSEILDGVDTAVLWTDDPNLAELADGLDPTRVVRVGTRGTGDLDVEVEREGDRIGVWAEGESLGSVPAEGGPHPGNLGCAVAAALAYGTPPSDVAQRLGSLVNPSHRATVGTSDTGVVVIDDTFNSNPAGAASAIDRLATAAPGTRVVATPGMVELGPVQDEENERLGQAVVESGATLVVVGWTNRRALLRGGGAGTVLVADRDEARLWVREHLGAGDGVLWENDLPDHYP